MKYILLIICLLPFTAFAETRTWLTSSGAEFMAEFMGHKSGAIALKSETGKKATVKVSDLSIVDRIYLMDKEGLSEEEVSKGFKKNHEERLRIDVKQFKKGEPVSITAGDQIIEFAVLETPHFQLWGERKVNLKKAALIAEKCWFYNAWRHPLYEAARGGKKELIIFTNSEESIRNMIRYHADNNPQLTDRQKSSMEARWYQDMRGFTISANLATERDLNRSCYLVRNDSHDITDEVDEQYFHTIYTRYLCQTTEKGTDVFNDHHGSGQYFIYGKGFDSELSYYGEIITGMGTETASSGNFGEPKVFGKKLLNYLSDEKEEVEIRAFFSDKKDLRTKKEFGWQVVSFGRFMHSDIKHEIGTARFFLLAQEKKKLPTPLELAECYGYESEQEMNDAFMEFLNKENLK